MGYFKDLCLVIVFKVILYLRRIPILCSLTFYLEIYELYLQL